MQTFAIPARLSDSALDGYAARGVSLSRDSAHVVIAALMRDAGEMRERGGSANLTQATINHELARTISDALNERVS